MQQTIEGASSEVISEMITVPAVFPEDNGKHFGRWHHNVPIENYHSDKLAVSRSGLQHILKNPREFITEWAKPYVPGTPAKGALRTGDLTHLILNEPEKFGATVVASPDFGDQRYTDNKKAKATFMTEHEGKIIVSPTEMSGLQGMADAVFAHPVLVRMLEGTVSEVTGYWVDAETGILCRIRPDRLRLEEGICLDWKTTEDASEDAFFRSIAKYKYHFQAAMYAEGISVILGIPYEQVRFVIAAIEKGGSFGIKVYSFTLEQMLRARIMLRHALRSLALCIDTNDWPSYPSRIVPARLPDYAFSVGGGV